MMKVANNGQAEAGERDVIWHNYMKERLISARTNM